MPSTPTEIAHVNVNSVKNSNSKPAKQPTIPWSILFRISISYKRNYWVFPIEVVVIFAVGLLDTI